MTYFYTLVFFDTWALLLAFFYTWALLLTFFYTWVLLPAFFYTWALLPSFYTWDSLLAFFSTWAFTLYPVFFHTWALTRLLVLLVPQSRLPSQPRWHYKSSDTDAPEHSQRHSPFSVLQTFSISCGGDRIPIKVCASDSSALLLRPWSTLHSSSFLPSVSHAGESFTYQDIRIWFFGFVTSTLEYSAVLIFLPSVSHVGESLTYQGLRI